MFATVLGSFLARDRRLEAGLGLASSAAHAASTARRALMTLECSSTGTGGAPIGFFPAAIFAARCSLGLLPGDFTIKVRESLSEPVRSGRDPPDDRLTGLGALPSLTRCRIPDLVGLRLLFQDLGHLGCRCADSCLATLPVGKCRGKPLTLGR